MKKIYILLLGLFASAAVSAQCSDLYFSEYAEGSSNNKYLEIFNPTDASIDLSGYSIYMINNGGSPNNIAFQLYGNLEAKGVFILSTNAADSASIRAKADTVLGYNSVTHFNGDDAVCLINGTDTIDVIGERWSDPGSSWTVGTGSTKDYTLVRKSSVGAGQTDWTIGATEWDVYAKDDWTNLGSHRSACTAIVAEIKNPGFDIEGDDKYRDFWRNDAFEDSVSNDAMIQITSGPVHEGAKAAKLPSSGERAGYQAVEVQPNTDYVVRFWYTMKTSPVGSANVAILDGDLVDPAQVAAKTIESVTLNDQTDANTYIQDSVEFTSGPDGVIAIYFTNVAVETRFDTWEIDFASEVPTEPMAAAADPTQASENVISVYSETYGDYAGANFYPNWGQSTQYEIFSIGEDSMIKYSNLNYQGIVLGSNIDASEMETLHLDIWSSDVENINIFPISASTAEYFVNQKLAKGTWTSVDIPLSDFTSQGLSISDIKEFKFDDLARSNGTIFVDNIYFWKPEPPLVYREASISELFQLDADLTPTNLDSLYEITGVVYGPDYDGNAGYSFSLIDDTKGINIHSFVDVDGVTDVVEGDEVTVKGHIVFYRGLLELRVDSIMVNSQGNALAEPTEVEKPDESTESEFIVLRKVWLAEEATVWPDNGNLLLTNEAKDTFQIRVDRDVADMVGQPIDYDTMTITGLGGQFTFDVPADNGYQIFPRMLSDVSEYEAPVNNVRNLELLAVELYPNPTSSSLTVRSTTAWNSFEVYSLQGVKVLEGALLNNSLEVSSLISGSYILKLQSADANGVARFIVNR